MPCDTKLREGQSLSDRMTEVSSALERLKLALGNARARIQIAPNGAVTFQGWSSEERRGLSDACAYRTLAAEGSWELRQAVARGEAMSGRKVNERAVLAGWHSHDGGQSWGRH